MGHVLTGVYRVNSAFRLGISKMNVQGYTDDIGAFAPASSGLREFLVNMKRLIYNYASLLFLYCTS